MVRKLGELPKFLVVNSWTESFGNSSVFAFYLLQFALIQNYSLLSEIAMGNGCYLFVNAIVTLLHCIYLMKSLHHNLSDLCKYLMMQIPLWQMVRTRTSEDLILDIPEGSTRRVGAKPHVEMLRLHHLFRHSAWNNYWQCRITSWGGWLRMTSIVGLNASNLSIKRGILHIQTLWQLTH
jgi:hypothetical protein